MIIVALILIISASAFAQPDSLWSRTYGGGESEQCFALQQTTDGGYVLAGLSASYGSGGADFWLLRTDANGDSLWSKTYGGSFDDRCFSVQQTDDGGYILAGTTESFGAGNFDFWLVKTNEDGDSLWSSTFGGGATEKCRSVRQTTDGGYALAGWSTSFGSGSIDFWLVKTDSNGDSLWSRSFGGEHSDVCLSVQQTNDEGYALIGQTVSFGSGENDLWLVKTDANGDSLWSRAFGTEGEESGSAVHQTADGDYILAGNSGQSNYLLMKTSAQGDSLWSHSYGGDGWDQCNLVQQTADGGYLLGGHTESFGGGSWDYWIVKTDAYGDSLWSRSFGESSSEECYAVQQSGDGGFVLAGFRAPSSSQHADFWLVKTGPDPTIDTDDYTVSIPVSLSLSAYPNPFNSTTTLTLNVPLHEHTVELAVVNTLGQVVKTASVQAAGGMARYSNDMSGFASGIYFVSAKAGVYQAARKIVLLK